MHNGTAAATPLPAEAEVPPADGAALPAAVPGWLSDPALTLPHAATTAMTPATAVASSAWVSAPRSRIRVAIPASRPALAMIGAGPGRPERGAAWPGPAGPDRAWAVRAVSVGRSPAPPGSAPGKKILASSSRAPARAVGIPWARAVGNSTVSVDRHRSA